MNVSSEAALGGGGSGSGEPEMICGSSTPFLTTRFYLVSVFGTALAVVAIVESLLLVYMLFTRPFFRRSYFLYFGALAVADVLVGFGYILVIAVSMLFEFREDARLMNVWYSYVIAATTVSQVALLMPPYLLLAASLERYLSVLGLSSLCTQRARGTAIAVVATFACLSKGGVFFELQVVDEPRCPSDTIGAKVLEPTAITTNYWYGTVFMFWYRQIATIFLPFFALVIVNLIIVIQDRCPCLRTNCCRRMDILRRDRDRLPNLHKLTTACQTDHEAAELEMQYQTLLMSVRIPYQLSRWVNRARERVRKSDTRTLVLVVVEQLLTSSLSLAITVWEHLDFQGLVSNLAFYLFAADAISILSLLACALRLPTYLIADVTFRKEIGWLVSCHHAAAKDPSSARRVLRRIPDSFHPQLLGAPNTMTLYPPDSRLRMRRNAIVIDADLLDPGPGFAGIAMSAYRRRHSVDQIRSHYDSLSSPIPSPRPSLSGPRKLRTISLLQNGQLGSNFRSLVTTASVRLSPKPSDGSQRPASPLAPLAGRPLATSPTSSPALLTSSVFRPLTNGDLRAAEEGVI